MSAGRLSRQRTSSAGAGWLFIGVLVVFTLSIGTAVHSHGVFDSDGGAEKVSQSKFTCPACVFDGKPVTVLAAEIVFSDTSFDIVTCLADASFESTLAETSSSRAPPAV